MRPTSESVEWILLATYLGLEILSAACDQVSSPRRPHFGLFGMLLAIAAVLISIVEIIYRGKKERVVFERRGMLLWFYHPPPPRFTPFGTLPDIYGLVAGISQCICSIVQYVYYLRHADSPLKASLLPAIFLMCLGGSRLSDKQMNANTTDNKVEGDIEKEWDEWEWLQREWGLDPGLELGLLEQKRRERLPEKKLDPLLVMWCKQEEEEGVQEWCKRKELEREREDRKREREREREERKREREREMPELKQRRRLRASRDRPKGESEYSKERRL